MLRDILIFVLMIRQPPLSAQSCSSAASDVYKIPTGRSQYSAPDGAHDDTVMALALAWHGIIHDGRILVRDAPREFANYRG